MRVFKAPMAVIDRQVISALQPLLYAFIGAAHHRVFVLFDFLHINRDRTVDHHAILAGASRHMGCTPAGDQALGRDATGVDNGATAPVALDDPYSLSWSP